MDKHKFEKSSGEQCGVYVANYQGEGVCKIGVTSDPRARIAALRGGTWVPVEFSAFFFAYAPSDRFETLPDDYSILMKSAYLFEKCCHDKLKELGLHLQYEFFEIGPVDAIAAIRKIAKLNGFRLAEPQDILAAGIDLDSRGDDRLAFLQMANAAGLAKEVMDAKFN